MNKEVKDNNLQDIKKKLRKRAMRFRYTAILALISSVILIIISIYLFLFASEISFNDNIKAIQLKSVDLTEVKQKRFTVSEEIKRNNEKLSMLNHRLDKYLEKFENEIKGNYTQGTSGVAGYGALARRIKLALEQINKQISETRDRINSLESLSEKLDKEELELRKIYQNRIKGMDNNISHDLSFSQIITTNITRIIVMGSLLFLVQILINLYMYNVRVAGHFDSIADAITLVPEQIKAEKFTTLINFLSTNKIDFGKTPNSVISNALEIIKASK